MKTKKSGSGVKREYSLHWNEKAREWIAKYKQKEGGWGTKRIPKTIGPGRTLEAEQWFIAAYRAYLENGGSWTAPKAIVIRKTFANMLPIWVEMRRERQIESSYAYFKTIESSVNCWILDNPANPHRSIQDLCVETEFTPDVAVEWINSIKTSPASVLVVLGIISAFYEDMIMDRRINPKITIDGEVQRYNPMTEGQVKRKRKELRALRDRSRRIGKVRIVTTVPRDSMQALTSDVRIPAIRRMAYLTTWATGARDNELRALTWADIDLDAGPSGSPAIPVIHITKQLIKPGPKPPLVWEEERAKGRSRDEITSSRQAVIADPKFNEQRSVPIHPEVVRALRWWRDCGWPTAVGAWPGQDDPVCPRVKSRTLDGLRGWFAHSGAADLLRLDLETLGLPTQDKSRTLVFHAIRHTFGSNLNAAGVPESIRASLLGHAGGNVTADSYTERDLEILAREVARLPITWTEPGPDIKRGYNLPKWSAARRAKIAAYVNRRRAEREEQKRQAEQAAE